MTSAPDELYRRYLGVLGWVGDPGLHELVSSHLIKVPFENVSALLRSAEPGSTAIPSIEEFIERISEQDLGGCGFAIPIHFASLLRFLEYDVELLAADVAGVPRARAVCRIHFEESPYLVDVGHAAPFYHPIDLSQLPHRVPHGDYEFTIQRHVSGAGAVEVATHHHGSKVHSYVTKSPALEPEGFEASALTHQDPKSAWLSSLRISRFFASRVLEVVDNNLISTHHNITTITPIQSLDELEAIVRDQLQLTRCPVGAAVEILRSRGIDIFAKKS